MAGERARKPVPPHRGTNTNRCDRFGHALAVPTNGPAHGWQLSRQFRSRAHTREGRNTSAQSLVHKCSRQRCPQEPGSGHSPSARQPAAHHRAIWTRKGKNSERLTWILKFAFYLLTMRRMNVGIYKALGLNVSDLVPVGGAAAGAPGSGYALGRQEGRGEGPPTHSIVVRAGAPTEGPGAGHGARTSDACPHSSQKETSHPEDSGLRPTTLWE